MYTVLWSSNCKNTDQNDDSSIYQYTIWCYLCTHNKQNK